MNLTREQAEAVAECAQPMFGYLSHLRQRVEIVGILPGDPPYRLARKTEEVAQRLSVDLH